ncbi:unnamed protein product [Amoebophrya sp. A25]|nr:unnamed protein product [Amoebophrya sp. A25]|eukprot:GSA25T00011541001.1
MPKSKSRSPEKKAAASPSSASEVMPEDTTKDPAASATSPPEGENAAVVPANSAAPTTDGAAGGEKSSNAVMSLLGDMLKQQKTRVCAESRLAPADKPHAFWDTQPVPKMTEAHLDTDQDAGPMEIKTLDDVRKEPYPLPDAFEWFVLDIKNDEEREAVYALLSENYVEDDDNMFRFEYSKEFLDWALCPPGYRKHWHVGVRVKSNHKFVAFISGIPAHMHICGKDLHVAEINYLCIHKKLRSKRLAPVLIKEVTRRINCEGIWQAVYTAGIVLPKPVAQCRYWHRSINPRKLIEIGFSHLQPRMTMSRTVKLYQLPATAQTPGFRIMEERDIPQVTDLLNNFLQKYLLRPIMSKDEVRHWVLPRKDVIYAMVREEKPGKITDVFSFYRLPSKILGNEKYNLLSAAYSYLNVAQTVLWKDLMYEALIHARDNDFDVFNALDVMENEEFLKDLKFGMGDGYLQYYVFNYRMPKLPASSVGLVLL